MIYHYTSCDFLSQIIAPHGFSLRASHYGTLGSMDYSGAKIITRPIIKEICSENNVPYAEQEPIYSYIICFSHIADDPMMWKNFGNNGAGIMLEIDDSVVASHAMRDFAPDVFMDCYYSDDKESIKEWLLECRTNVLPTISDSLQNDLIEVSAFLIPTRFSYQREMRYIIPYRTGGTISRNKKGNVVFQEEEKPTLDFRFEVFDKRVLKSIILGENCSMGCKAIQRMLKDNGYQDVNVLTLNEFTANLSV